VNLISVNGLRKNAGMKTLFSGLSFGLSEGEKIALIGRNGSGKSTLMKILAGATESDGGEVVKNTATRIAYLAQNASLDNSISIEEFFRRDANPAVALLLEYEKAAQNGFSDRLSELEHEMEKTGAWFYQSTAKSLLKALGIDNLSQKLGELSGGMKRKVEIADFLLHPADCLMLDEPTNHLDMQSIAFLEKYLMQTRSCLFIITHDRYFLENITDTIWEISTLGLRRYKGNYATYLTLKEEEILSLERSEEKRLKKLATEKEWLNRQPKARGTKARARIDLVEKLKIPAYTKESDIVAFASESARLGKTILQAINISRSYGNTLIFPSFHFAFEAGQRIGVIGGNGSGKSTLLSILAGVKDPDTGSVIRGVNTRIGYFDQQAENLREDASILASIQEFGREFKAANGDRISAKDFLEMFLFPPEEQHRPVSSLSGGERRRLYLLTILAQSPNFLILDEPTNDLDLSTLQVLEDYLIRFPGTLLVVSHDRYFLDRTVDSFLIMDKGEEIVRYAGTASEAVSLLTERKEPAVEKAVREKNRSEKLSYKDQREKDNILKEIPTMEKRLETIHGLLSGGETDPEKLMRLSQEYEQLEEKLFSAMERLESLGG